MKKLLKLLLSLLLLFGLPSGVLAFADAPVAVVILDESGGGMDKDLPDTWIEQVRRNFSFPDYKLIEQTDLLQILRGRLPQPDKKSPYYQKSHLQYIAELTQAELVIVIRVGRMREEVFHSYSRGLQGETFVRVELAIDVTSYKKSVDRYLSKKIRYFNTDSISVLPSVKKLAVYEVEDAIYYFREQYGLKGN